MDCARKARHKNHPAAFAHPPFRRIVQGPHFPCDAPLIEFLRSHIASHLESGSGRRCSGLQNALRNMEFAMEIQHGVLNIWSDKTNMKKKNATCV